MHKAFLQVISLIVGAFFQGFECFDGGQIDEPQISHTLLTVLADLNQIEPSQVSKADLADAASVAFAPEREELEKLHSRLTAALNMLRKGSERPLMQPFKASDPEKLNVVLSFLGQLIGIEELHLKVDEDTLFLLLGAKAQTMRCRMEFLESQLASLKRKRPTDGAKAEVIAATGRRDLWVVVDGKGEQDASKLLTFFALAKNQARKKRTVFYLQPKEELSKLNDRPWNAIKLRDLRDDDAEILAKYTELFERESEQLKTAFLPGQIISVSRGLIHNIKALKARFGADRIENLDNIKPLEDMLIALEHRARKSSEEHFRGEEQPIKQAMQMFEGVKTIDDIPALKQLEVSIRDALEALMPSNKTETGKPLGVGVVGPGGPDVQQAIVTAVARKSTWIKEAIQNTTDPILKEELLETFKQESVGLPWPQETDSLVASYLSMEGLQQLAELKMVIDAPKFVDKIDGRWRISRPTTRTTLELLLQSTLAPGYLKDKMVIGVSSQPYAIYQRLVMAGVLDSAGVKQILTIAAPFESAVEITQEGLGKKLSLLVEALLSAAVVSTQKLIAQSCATEASLGDKHYNTLQPEQSDCSKSPSRRF